ncbi:MAG: hypothetical protein PHR36_00670 [Patescibacteria group bacterium]|nr:hypothetical protein [Patescibacteria group bacterium]
MFRENFLAQLNEDEKLTAAEDKVCDEMRRVKEPGLKEEDFEGVYSKTEIERDLELTKRLEKGHALHTERGGILEEVLRQQIYHSCWLGDNCETAQTTKFDDYINHTDFVIEWDTKDRIKLAVDTTVTNDPEVIEKKVIKVKNELDRKMGTTIKYFQSNLTWEDNPEKGELKDIPSVIIAFDYDNLKKMCEIIAGPNGKERLGKTSLQIYILEDIISQLGIQEEYLRKNIPGGSDTNIYKNIKRAKEYLEEILETKRQSAEIENRGNVKNESISEREKFTLLAA